MTRKEIFEALIEHAEKNSDDPRLKVGSCIINGGSSIFGTNRFREIPDGYTKEELVADRNLKLKYITHAEVDAILESGEDIQGSTVYVNYTPCIDCAKRLIAAGVAEVVVLECKEEGVVARWKESWDQSISLFENNGVRFAYHN